MPPLEWLQQRYAAAVKNPDTTFLVADLNASAKALYEDLGYKVQRLAMAKEL